MSPKNYPVLNLVSCRYEDSSSPPTPKPRKPPRIKPSRPKPSPPVPSEARQAFVKASAREAKAEASSIYALHVAQAAATEEQERKLKKKDKPVSAAAVTNAFENKAREKQRFLDAKAKDTEAQAAVVEGVDSARQTRVETKDAVRRAKESYEAAAAAAAVLEIKTSIINSQLVPDTAKLAEEKTAAFQRARAATAAASEAYVGHKKKKTLKKCPKDKVRNPETNRCKNKTKACPKDKARDPDSKRCVSIRGGSRHKKTRKKTT